MRVSVYKSKAKGRVKVPSSKSYTLRGLICAALAKGRSEIINPLTSDDTEACLDVLAKVGVDVQQKDNSWQVAGGYLRKPKTDLLCGESAATWRFMTAICSLVPGKCRLIPAKGLSRRPIQPLIEALRKLGVNILYRDDAIPVIVGGGKIQGGRTRLPGDVSSQFVSALLFISPFAEGSVKIKLTTPLESKPFLMMTIDCLQKFGIEVNSSEDLMQFEVLEQEYKPAKYRVEGDWSSASYFLALGAMTGEVELENLNPESMQGDRVISDFLRNMGASVDIKKGLITVSKSRLKAISVDLSDCIDLLPTMAVLAAAAKGVSEFTGIERARLKESDRVSAVREGLGRMGIKVEEERNRMTITGSKPKGAIIDPKNDHRIAMAFSILGSVAGGTVIENAECVSKTFPEFWDVLKMAGGKVKIYEQ